MIAVIKTNKANNKLSYSYNRINDNILTLQYIIASLQFYSNIEKKKIIQVENEIPFTFT